MRPSTATHGDLSVAEIRRQQAQEGDADQKEIRRLVERARGAEEAGKSGVAKIYYNMAARRAEGEMRRQILDKIKDLESGQP